MATKTISMIYDIEDSFKAIGKSLEELKDLAKEHLRNVKETTLNEELTEQARNLHGRITELLQDFK